MAVDWDKHVLAPCEAVFGEEEEADYIPRTGAAYTIGCIFDSAYKDVSLIDVSVDANSVQPVAGIRVVALHAPVVQGDQIRIKSVGKLYLVQDYRPDGHGWAKLMLSDTGQP